MQNESKNLVYILRYFNDLMSNLALGDAQIGASENIPLTLEHYEKKIGIILNSLQKCDKKNIAMIDNLLGNLHLQLLLYLNDLNKLYYLFCEILNAYQKIDYLPIIKNIHLNKKPQDKKLIEMLEQIYKVLLFYNISSRRKIIYKNDLIKAQDTIANISELNNELYELIIALENIDKKNIKETTKYLSCINIKIGDIHCELDIFRKFIQKQAEFYGNKATKIAWKKLCCHHC